MFEVVSLVTKRGNRLEYQNPALLKQQLSRLPDGQYEWRLADVKENRSKRANRYYFGVVLAFASDHTGYDKDELHEYFKRRFNPVPTPKLSADDGEGEIIGGSTAKLPRDRFYQFVEDVRRFLVTELGVETPDPDPAYWRKAA